MSSPADPAPNTLTLTAVSFPPRQGRPPGVIGPPGGGLEKHENEIIDRICHLYICQFV